MILRCEGEVRGRETRDHECPPCEPEPTTPEPVAYQKEHQGPQPIKPNDHEYESFEVN